MLIALIKHAICARIMLITITVTITNFNSNKS